MPERLFVAETITGIFSPVPLVLYTVAAIVLTLIALFPVRDPSVLIFRHIMPPASPVNSISIINALPPAIALIILFETVTVYFKSKHVEVRASAADRGAWQNSGNH